jgi:anti-sigma-K factor RskA
MNADLHGLTGAYAAGALSGDEHRAFESHMAECAECAQEVREFEAAAARLGAAEEAVPPPRMRAAVLSRISQVRQLPPEVDDGGDLGRGPGPGPGPGPGNGHGSGPITLPESRRASSLPVPTWIAAAAAAVLLVAAVALGAISANLNSDLSDLRAQSAQVSRVLAASDARTVSARVGSTGSSSVVVSEQLDSAVFAAAGLSAPPKGDTYQLWYVGADGPRSAGLFEPDSHGSVTRVLEGDLGGARAVAFTVEPAGGSEHPTTKPVLALELPV